MLVVAQALSEGALSTVHCAVRTGRFRAAKTLANLHNFYRPDCRCTAEKGPSGQSWALMQPYGVNILGPFPKTDRGELWTISLNGLNAYALPYQSTVTVADKLLEEFFCRHAIPEELHSDQGRNFEAQIFGEMCSRLGTQTQNHSTAPTG